MKLGFERSFVESEPGAEWLLEDLRALGDLCLPGGLGKAIPWTGVEAVVTAKDSSAHGNPKFLGNRALVFDGKKRNTAPVVELLGGRDGLGWTGIDASGASSAAVRKWLVWLEI